MRKIFIILICLLIANPAFAAPLKSPLDKLLKYFKNGEMIKIQSYTAKNFIIHNKMLAKISIIDHLIYFFCY